MKHDQDDDEIPEFRRNEVIGDSLELVACQNCGHEHEGGRPCPVCNHINEVDDEEDPFD